MSKHPVEKLRDDILVLDWSWVRRNIREGGARVVWKLDEPYETWCTENLTEVPRIMVIPGYRSNVATPVAKFACDADMIQFKLMWLSDQ